MTMLSDKSPELTTVGPVRFPVAVRVASQRWLSVFRWPASMRRIIPIIIVTTTALVG
jgi:hypothetical protein